MPKSTVARHQRTTSKSARLFSSLHRGRAFSVWLFFFLTAFGLKLQTTSTAHSSCLQSLHSARHGNPLLSFYFCLHPEAVYPSFCTVADLGIFCSQMFGAGALKLQQLINLNILFDQMFANIFVD